MDPGYAGTSTPCVYILAAYAYAGTSVPWWMLGSFSSEEEEPTVVEYLDPVVGNRCRPPLRTVHVPRVTGKNVRRFGQNRGRY